MNERMEKMQINTLTRRSFVAGAAATVAACSTTGRGTPGQRIDQRVDAAIQFMYEQVPGTRDLAQRAAGMLVMPVITKAGFGIGGAYGEGALRIGGATVGYYSMAQGSWGLQIGAQQYAHTLFFMTPEALADFRSSQGWAIGADAEVVVKDTAGRVGVESTNVLAPIIAVVFGQAGLIVGASLEGTKYSPIIR